MGHQEIKAQSMAACIGKTSAFMQEKVIGDYWLKKKERKKGWQSQEVSLQYSLHTLHLLNDFQN